MQGRTSPFRIEIRKNHNDIMVVRVGDGHEKVMGQARRTYEEAEVRLVEREFEVLRHCIPFLGMPAFDLLGRVQVLAVGDTSVRAAQAGWYKVIEDSQFAKLRESSGMPAVAARSAVPFSIENVPAKMSTMGVPVPGCTLNWWLVTLESIPAVIWADAERGVSVLDSMEDIKRSSISIFGDPIAPAEEPGRVRVDSDAFDVASGS